MSSTPPPGQGAPTAHPAVSARACAALALAQAFTTILTGLRTLIFANFHRLPDIGSLLHNRVNRAMRRVEALLLRAASGRAPRTYPPRPGRPSGSRPVPFPRRRAWLLAALPYKAALYTGLLDQLFEKPETRATLKAAPAETRLAIARALRPICNLLAVDLPSVLQRAGPPKPPRRRPPKPPRPKPEPMRPLPAYVRAAVRAWKPRYG